MVPRTETFGAVFRPASARGAGWEIAAAGVVRALLWLAVPVLILQVFDRAVPSARAVDLIPLTLGVAAALAARGGLDLVAAAVADAEVQARGRIRIWVAITGLFAGRAAPTADGPPEIALAASTFPPGLLRLAGLPVLAGALTYLAGVLAAPAVTLALAAAGAAYLFHRKAAPMPGAPGGAGTQFAERILDTLWTIKAMGAENLVLRLAESARRAETAAGRTRSHPLVSAGRAAALFDRGAVVLTVLLGTVLCLNGLMTVGQLAAGVLIAGALARDSYGGTAAWTLSRADGVPAPAQGADLEPAREPLPRVTGSLMLNRVSFDEHGGLRVMARTLFDRIRVEVEAGEAVLITGGNAQMQTALLRLMAGLETPRTGTVTVDGYDLAAYRLDSIRRQIAYVPPLGDVLPGTLRENLTAFDPGRAADALGAARLTGLDVKATCLVDGFDTRLQGDAAGFPAGFRQHLAVTRALAFKPKVLLLDRATENLDSQDLRAVAEVLERLKRRVTIVYASTQAGLRAMADRVIELDALKPVPETGTIADDDADSEPRPDGEG